VVFSVFNFGRSINAMTMDSEGFDDDDDSGLLYSFLTGGTGIMLGMLGAVMGMGGEPRAKSVFDQRLDWEAFQNRHGKRQFFRRHLRMEKRSFKKLLSYIREDIPPNEGMAALR
jgi:hypothetical protein